MYIREASAYSWINRPCGSLRTSPWSEIAPNLRHSLRASRRWHLTQDKRGKSSGGLIIDFIRDGSSRGLPEEQVYRVRLVCTLSRLMHVSTSMLIVPVTGNKRESPRRWLNWVFRWFGMCRVANEMELDKWAVQGVVDCVIASSKSQDAIQLLTVSKKSIQGAFGNFMFHFNL